MKRILLCSSNPLLVKSLYATLRDEGYAVEEVEHPSLAVQKVLAGSYDLTIMDAEPFGMSAEEAARVLAAIAPGMPILCTGGDGRCGAEGQRLITVPADPDAIKEMIHHVAA
jgi:DNA-binding response OmpR family regulator